MFRFIVNFVLFGFIFYGIYLFMPGAFNTLVGWADQAVVYGQDFYQKIMDQFSSGGGGATSSFRF